MSLEKAIKSGKEHRKPYYGCKAFDKSCRNHGDDDWMLENRMHSTTKRKAKADYTEEEQSEYDRLLQLRASYVVKLKEISKEYEDCAAVINLLTEQIKAAKK